MFLKCLLALSLMTPVYAADSIVATDHQKYSYREMCDDLSQLSSRYNDVITVSDIGQSADHRVIKAVMMGNVNARKVFVVMANLHAREYMTTNLVMKQIEEYAKAYESDSTINNINIRDYLTSHAIAFIPTVNPDGMMISQQGFRAIRNKKLRKNLLKMKSPAKTWKANGRGVDLNCNFSYKFVKTKKIAGNGYSGPKAFSESESRALRDYLLSLKKKQEISGLLSYHSTGSIIYGDISKTGTVNVKKGNALMNRVIKKMTGYKSAVLQEKSVKRGKVIKRGGFSRNYFNYTLKIPAVTVEVGKKPCPLAINEFKPIYKKNKALPLALAEKLSNE